MKRFLITFITIFVTIILLIGAGAGVFLYRKFAPSKERADQAAWYGVSGDETAVLLNNEQEEGVRGRSIGGQAYLPLTWVQDTLNERFYWDEENHQLIYTLPDQIVYADASTTGSSGKPLFVEQEDQVWLMTGLVSTYTDVRMEAFLDSDVKRIYVDTDKQSAQMAVLKKAVSVRVRGGVKSEILCDEEADASVEVLEEMENWTRVRTADGYVGYVQNKRLGAAAEQPYVSNYQEPVYTSISMEEPVSLVWHQVTSQAANQAMPELMANVKNVNVIAPTWFMLTKNDGTFESLASQTYVDQAHGKGLQVWAVMDNFNKGDEVQSEVLFASTNARKKLIEGVMKEVKKYGIDGINLDIEGIKPAAGPHYVQFIRELSVSCRKDGVVLSVDTYVPSSYTSFYNRAEQGRVADYVVIMGYDEHYAGGEAGSVASIGYESQGIEDTLKQVPKEKIISAIPFYTRLWNVKDDKTTSQAMGIASAKKWVNDNKVELYWQEELGQYYGELEKDGGKYMIWLEEEKSLEKKIALVRDNELGGIAYWKLGFETADIWNLVKLR